MCPIKPGIFQDNVILTIPKKKLNGVLFPPFPKQTQDLSGLGERYANFFFGKFNHEGILLGGFGAQDQVIAKGTRGFRGTLSKQFSVHLNSAVGLPAASS